MIEPAFWSSATGIAIVVVCTTISLVMTTRWWVTRTFDPVLPKVIWSLIVLFLPVLGWMLFAGLYRTPRPHGEGDPYYHGLG